MYDDLGDMIPDELIEEAAKGREYALESMDTMIAKLQEVRDITASEDFNPLNKNPDARPGDLVKLIENVAFVHERSGQMRKMFMEGMGVASDLIEALIRARAGRN
jgi:hypothetical protein